MMRFLGVTALLLSLMCANGPRYNVAVKNRTSEPLTAAYVSFGEFRSLDRPLPLDGHTRQGRVPFPIPDRATVTWRGSDGVSHTKEVEVTPLVPKDFTGDIFFDIYDGEQVVVRVEPDQ
jgi:hypothetical protein